MKVVDPSANPYLATAAILGLALDGIERELPLLPEVAVDPGALSADERSKADIGLLSTDQGAVVAALAESALLRGILGDAVVDSVVAVRRYEHEHFGELTPEQLAEKFRLAWSL